MERKVRVLKLIKPYRPGDEDPGDEEEDTEGKMEYA
jgi:hypothetical protein